MGSRSSVAGQGSITFQRRPAAWYQALGSDGAPRSHLKRETPAQDGQHRTSDARRAISLQRCQSSPRGASHTRRKRNPVRQSTRLPVLLSASLTSVNIPSRLAATAASPNQLQPRLGEPPFSRTAFRRLSLARSRDAAPSATGCHRGVSSGMVLGVRPLGSPRLPIAAIATDGGGVVRAVAHSRPPSGPAPGGLQRTTRVLAWPRAPLGPSGGTELPDDRAGLSVRSSRGHRTASTALPSPCSIDMRAVAPTASGGSGVLSRVSNAHGRKPNSHGRRCFVDESRRQQARPHEIDSRSLL